MQFLILGVGQVGCTQRAWPSPCTRVPSEWNMDEEEAEASGCVPDFARSNERSEDKILYDLLVYCKWPEIATGVVSWT